MHETYIILQISEPILFLSGSQDEMVPPVHMKRLYDLSSSNPRSLFVEFPTGMHMDTWSSGGDRYWRTIQLFLEKYVGSPRVDGEEGSVVDAQ